MVEAPSAVEQVNALLERHWDPIGVYPPGEPHAPPGEYATYASYIVDWLHAGGGRQEVLEVMLLARMWMGLVDSRTNDEAAAEKIVKWWADRCYKLG